MSDVQEWKPFTPKGEIPQWEMVYHLISPLQVGDQISYDQLTAELGFDIRSNRSPVYRAIKELENQNLKTMEVVVGVGYRVVAPDEHERLARRHHGRGRRQLGQALNKLRSANRAQMSPEQARRFDVMEVTVSRHSDILRRLDGRVTRFEQALEESRAQQAESQQEIAAKFAKMEAALRRRGIDIDKE